MLAITLSLGVWQVERLHWKRALLAEIDRGEARGAVLLGTDPLPFTRVFTTGRFIEASARYGAEVRSIASGPTMGSQVVGALATTDGRTVIVDRGWAPDDASVPTPPGEVRVEGYVRPPDHALMLGAKDDPAARRFYALDPGPIGASLGQQRVAPFTLVVLGPPGGIPEPAQAMPRPPNDHLSYAITWFSLAAILVVVFVVFARQSRKGPLP